MTTITTITTVLFSLVSPFIMAYAPGISDIKDVLKDLMPTPINVEEQPQQLKYNSPRLYIAEHSSYTLLSSWYGPYYDGRQTANGEIFDQYDLTAAHPSLPFGTKLRVTYRGRSVVVRINDRGPYSGDRELDLSFAAAQAIGLIDVGVDYVTVTELN
jgi:rare lipoprotein A (peptidoglycan hydrolase)